jgi:hypothetical protein
MRYAILALMLLACSSSASTPEDDAWVAPTDARLPTDTAEYTVCAGFFAHACTAPPSDLAERLGLAAGAWRCLDNFGVSDAQREAARTCMCAAAGAVAPSTQDAAGQRIVRAGCCGRVPLSSAWCPDAG